MSWVMNTTPMCISSLQLANQLQDLGLNGHVQRGGRLVGDQQRRLAASAMAIMTRWRMPPDS